MALAEEIITEHAGKTRRQLLMDELKRQMSGISEEAFCAAWDYRVADELPPVLVDAAASGFPRSYHGAVIWPLHAAWLVSLATELGHWVTNEQGKVVAYHLSVPSSSAANSP